MSESDATPTEVDVLIIGMGPVGKMAGLLLGRAGRSVLVVDRRPADFRLPRAVGLDSEIARLLQRVDLAVDTIPDAVEVYDGMYVWTNAAGDVLQEIDMRGTGPSAWNSMYSFHQPDLEARLADALGAVPTVTVQRGVVAQVVAQDADAVTVGLTPTDGGTASSVRARYVIGTDGANSTTRTDVGIDWHDLGYFFDWLVVDVLPGDGAEVTDLAMQICDPARPTSVVPSGPGRRRWEFMVLEGEDPKELERPERIWQLLAPFGVTPENSQVDRSVVYSFAAGWAEHWRRGRVFLAGDAAHLMPPFAVQGLASGFRDVLNLAWKLELVFRGEAREVLLDTYETERVAHVNDFIRFAIMLGQVICITDPAVAGGRDAQMIAARKALVAPEQPPAPRLGAGLHVGDHGGELSRQGFVSFGSTGAPVRFDDVFGPGALVHRTGAIDQERVDALAALGIAVASFGVDGPGSFLDVAGTYTAWFDEWGADAILIRPDFSVYGVVPIGADPNDLALRFVEEVQVRHPAPA